MLKVKGFFCEYRSERIKEVVKKCQFKIIKEVIKVYKYLSMNIYNRFNALVNKYVILSI